ncbi:MAG: RDD family protein [Thermodesulfovibrionia bacterium]|nr:RDD family protein [Thermodesulfovibrionia bacterium]
MNESEKQAEKQEFAKTRILNRVIAKSIDFIIIAALLEAIPKIGYFAGLAYLLIGDGLFEGKSIGKRLLGLKVVFYETGTACTFKASIIRNFIFAIGYFLMIIPLIGFLFPLIVLFFESMLIIGSDRGLRFGDELIKTQVVEETRQFE